MKIGDRVVAKATGYFLRRDTIYIIVGIYDCICGNVLLDVGLDNGEFRGTICSNCGTNHPQNGGLHNRRLFAPLQFDHCHDELIEKLVTEAPDLVKEKENV